MKLRMLTIHNVRVFINHRHFEKEFGFITGFFGGSRATCSPPPANTDNDLFIHVKDVSNALTVLIRSGWKMPTDIDQYDGEYIDFATVRRGEYNILLFSNPYEFGAVWGATCVAKELNLKRKSDRYALFEAARGPWREK